MPPTPFTTTSLHEATTAEDGTGAVLRGASLTPAQAIARRDRSPESWLWETEDGRRWLTRLLAATLYTFGLKRGVGLETISEFFMHLRLATQHREATEVLELRPARDARLRGPDAKVDGRLVGQAVVGFGLCGHAR